MKSEDKEIVETEVLPEPDFLVGICPMNINNLEDCTACQ